MFRIGLVSLFGAMLLLAIPLTSFSNNEKQKFTNKNNETEIQQLTESVEMLSEQDILDNNTFFFFGEEVFEDEFMSPYFDPEVYRGIIDKSTMGVYFLLIYPAVYWLSEDSLQIVEIL